jgi:hypothetical protein
MSVRKSLTVLAAAATLCTASAPVVGLFADSAAAAHSSTVEHTVLADTPWGSPVVTPTPTPTTTATPADDAPWG